MVHPNRCVEWSVKMFNAWCTFPINFSHMHRQFFPRSAPVRVNDDSENIFFFPTKPPDCSFSRIHSAEHLLIREWSCFLAVLFCFRYIKKLYIKLKIHKRRNMKKSDERMKTSNNKNSPSIETRMNVKA